LSLEIILPPLQREMQAHSLEVKKSEHETDHLLPPSAKDGMRGAINSPPPAFVVFTRAIIILPWVKGK